MHYRRALTWLCVLFFKEVVSKEESVILKVTVQMGVGTGQGRVQSQACCWRNQGLGAPQPRGSVRLRGCAQIPLQGWGDRGHTNLEIHNTGVQSCTWSYSFTWAALGMSHTSAGTRPRSCAVGQELAAPAFCGARASLAPAGCEAGPAEQGAPEIE